MLQASQYSSLAVWIRLATAYWQTLHSKQPWKSKEFEMLFLLQLQCQLDIATLDIAAALAIATATRVTDLRQYINSDLGYSDLKFLSICTE